MRTRCETGRADIADDVTLTDCRSVSNRNSTQVTVGRRVLPVVLHPDMFSVATLGSRVRDLPPSDGANGSPSWGGIVGAVVAAPALKDGMKATAETGTDPREFERRLEKHLFAAPPLGVKEAHITGAILACGPYTSVWILVRASLQAKLLIFTRATRVTVAGRRKTRPNQPGVRRL